MTIEYSTEKFRAAWPEIETLIEAHWSEIAIDRDKIPLDVDVDQYFAMDDANRLHVLTVRDNSRLIGYHIAIVSGMLHYKSTLHAITDVYFILPEYRKGTVGLRMFKEFEQRMRNVGVQKLFTGTKRHKDMGQLFEYLGYDETERLFTKYIGV